MLTRQSFDGAVHAKSQTLNVTLLAMLLILLIRTGMGLANVTAEYQLAAVGTLLILAILIGNIAERIRRRAPRPQVTTP